MMPSPVILKKMAPPDPEGLQLMKDDFSTRNNRDIELQYTAPPFDEGDKLWNTEFRIYSLPELGRILFVSDSWLLEGIPS